MAVALTNIRHGKEDGTILEVAYGESTKDLPDEVIAELKAQGLVGDLPKALSEAQANEVEALKAEIAELEALKDEAEADADNAEAELAALKAQINPA